MCRIAAPLVALLLLLPFTPAQAERGVEAARAQAEQLMNAGNFNEALIAFRELLLDKTNAPHLTPQDLHNALACILRLGREREADELIEKTAALQPHNALMLEAAAEALAGLSHQGCIIAGNFERGYCRDSGEYVDSSERDRARALQFMAQALPLRSELSPSAVYDFQFLFARLLLGEQFGRAAWRLQYRTDLTTLPDYDEHRWGGSRMAERRAPVAPDGQPVYYRVPASFEAAANDGERWRWALSQAAAADPTRASEVQLALAGFFRGQFGVETLAEFRWLLSSRNTPEQDESGTYALHTLAEDETIARLATGITRFTLPDEFNYILIYKRVLETSAGSIATTALQHLAVEFENRRQYTKAAEYWKRALPVLGDTAAQHLAQITGAWGSIEAAPKRAAAENAEIAFRFRNATAVHFEAVRLDVELLLNDMMQYLRSDPRQLDWRKTSLNDLGYRLVEEGETKYLTGTARQWDAALEPRENHFDRRVTIATPIREPGAYLITASVAEGNVTKVVLWVEDTVIARKPLRDGQDYLVLDARSGAPVPDADLTFFGWRQEYREPPARRFKITTTEFHARTDGTGQALASQSRLTDNAGYQWLVIAHDNEKRFAFLGFSSLWSSTYDQEYSQTKGFLITDRPVYRPGQTVKFKVWIAQAQYDQSGVSDFAGRTFTLLVRNAQGQEVFSKAYATDQFGGFDGEYPLPENTGLGNYSVELSELHSGLGTFRVEEYKKPEFEVTIEAPKEPLLLGEKITASIKAKYYFGAPVTHARVKYKVLRSRHAAEWYPSDPWDWLYGRGYWWFGYEYAWLPGWREWGITAPQPRWLHEYPVPPEVVHENEAPIGADGTVAVEIDTRAAKELFGDTDQRYEITAEVTDQSRRTIVGRGEVLAARKPFQVYAWLERGFLEAGDAFLAHFSARTLDGKGVQGKGSLRLLSLTYDEKQEPIEHLEQEWSLDTDADGAAQLQLKASRPGQYRLSYTVVRSADSTAGDGARIEGGYVFTVRGSHTDDAAFRFQDLELVPDKREYAPGETVRLSINTNKAGSTVFLFARPSNGVYLPPKILRLSGKSAVEEIAVTRNDMPNFFVEALTVADGRVFTATKEIVVPPQQRVLRVAVLPSAQDYKPGQQASVRLKLTDFWGKPFVGSTALAVYDRSVDYISGGSNLADIKVFFWKWRRSHTPVTEHNLAGLSPVVVPKGGALMQAIGLFGAEPPEVGGLAAGNGLALAKRAGPAGDAVLQMAEAPPAAAALPVMAGAPNEEAAAPPAAVQPAVRSAFADTAYWNGSLTTDKNGLAEISFTMPENLTEWKIAAWAMGAGTRVGQGDASVVTRKNLVLRLQAPRFFVEKDEVALSANIHNYLRTEKQVDAVLELGGVGLDPLDPMTRQLAIPAGDERRIDWRVKATAEGEAIVRMKALTDEESDAMEMRVPVYVHGMLKTEAFSGALRAQEHEGSIQLRVPQERRPEQSRLELRFSPTLAGAMLDALPYLAAYPYGCTEQTLNRFLPSVITQRTLQRLHVDLKTIGDKRANLNAQQIGLPTARAAEWQRWQDSPVFNEDELRTMVESGVARLGEMQLSDGGWGWFSGYGEQSYPHTTAYIVHGLQIANANGTSVPVPMLERGIAWLVEYRARELQKIGTAQSKNNEAPQKPHADDLDAFVEMVLSDAGRSDTTMREYLFRDKNELSVYAKALLGLALAGSGRTQEAEQVLRNIEQYLVQDDENQTAYLKLANEYSWWYWYGSEIEADAYYLKLLTRLRPDSSIAPRLVKYLLNNRSHAVYWNSTRDTAIVLEAFSEYLGASGEAEPELAIEVLLDGKVLRTVNVNRDNLFLIDNTVVLEGAAVTAGEHTVTFRKTGKGPLYYNAYLTNFTLEDPIRRTGLEVKVNRAFYRLNRAEKIVQAAGARGQALEQRAEHYERVALEDGAWRKSGDLIEVELEIESKNDYEYLVFEDFKPGGFEAVEVRSGYLPSAPGAYVEFRDNRTAFFMHTLPRGKRSFNYRLRAEIPGRFSALPARGYAMYAPELKSNSDEIKITIAD